SPAAIATTPLSGVLPVELNTATGVLDWVTVPLPSWPSAFNPQHQTAPALVKAQACESPAATATTLFDRPETCTGVLELAAAPLPSWPELPIPQHSAAPAVVTAQVK